MKIFIATAGIFLAFLACPPSAMTQAALSPADKRVIASFEKAAKKYVKLRNGLQKRVGKLPDEATPEQIAAHKVDLRKLVQASRAGAKQGDVFTPAAASLVRTMIKTEFKGYERAEIRENALEIDTKGVPLKVNAVYPESKELVEMSPALLLALPQLPKELRYRYIGRSLVILDRDTGLIVDIMRDALP